MVQLLLSLAVLIAQTAAPVAQRAGAAGPSPAYIVGPNDVLGIKVFGEPELSTLYTVDADGTITFPFLQRVPVGGKTVAEIEYALRKGLDPDWIKNAQVSVEITSYRSRAIYVIGEVRNPAKYTIEGQTTLLEVIAQAGSFTPNAAQNIIVHALQGGPRRRRCRHAGGAGRSARRGNHARQSRGAQRGQAAGQHHAAGRRHDLRADGRAVLRHGLSSRTPGKFVLRPGMTVRQAIAVAGGLTERGSDRRIKIIRKVNGKEVEIDAKMSDLVKPNDTIRVPQRLI